MKRLLPTGFATAFMLIFLLFANTFTTVSATPPGPTPHKMTVCHHAGPDPKNWHTITIDVAAWPAHQAHGDTDGPCAPVQATSTPMPTIEPTQAPTVAPTVAPTEQPTQQPTTAPTVRPTTGPTVQPTSQPTEQPEVQPTQVANAPVSAAMPQQAIGGKEFLQIVQCHNAEFNLLNTRISGSKLEVSLVFYESLGGSQIGTAMFQSAVAPSDQWLRVHVTLPAIKAQWIKASVKATDSTGTWFWIEAEWFDWGSSLGSCPIQ